MKKRKIWMAIVTDDHEVAFSRGCQSQGQGQLAIVQYLRDHEDFDGRDFREVCIWIAEKDLRLDLMVFEMQGKDFEGLTFQQGLLVEPPPNEKDAYRVVYVIDVLAGSAMKAASVIHQIMTDPESMGPVLEVINPRGKITQIDLNDCREPQ